MRAAWNPGQDFVTESHKSARRVRRRGGEEKAPARGLSTLALGLFGGM